MAKHVAEAQIIEWLQQNGGYSELSFKQISDTLQIKKITLYHAVHRLHDKEIITVTYVLKDPSKNKVTPTIQLNQLTN